MTSTLVAAVGTNSRALWYLTRGFGLIDLVLLTAAMVLGLTQVVGFSRPGLPRFVIAALHRNVSILAVVLLVVHVATAVADTFAPISIASVFIPFVGQYRPLWLGLGALALDLLLALVVTSLLRERMGYRTWRALHWTAYLCWPVAILHGLGTGSDTKISWVLALNALCVVAVLAAIWWRLARGWAPANTGRRGLAFMGTLVVPLAAGVWTATGPLQPGWAKRAGTPTALLGTHSAAASAPATAGGPAAQPAGLKVPLSANFTGTQSQNPSSNGLVAVTLKGSFTGGSFQVVLNGQPLANGGVELTGSQVTLGSSASPDQYRGQVTRLSGARIIATLESASGQTLTATIRLATQGASISGTIEAS